MRAYEASVNTFGVAKVPRFRRKLQGAGVMVQGTVIQVPSLAQERRKVVRVQSNRRAVACWLCPASDHYASDPQLHPRPATVHKIARNGAGSVHMGVALSG